VRLFPLLLKILAIFLLIIPPIIAVKQPAIMQGSDFVMTFYPVGKMVASGLAQNIYPPATVTSFVQAPFNIYVHELLSFLPKNFVAIYMYSPLTALVFVPFSFLTPTYALVAWQLFSTFVLALIAYILSRRETLKTIEYFCMFALFCPIFHTLLIGHVGIILGLLPLALGYAFLSRGRELAAGISWGALILKPQFLPAALLVCGALFFSKKPKAAIGLGCGFLIFGLATAFALGPDMFIDWLKSFKMSDTIFASAGYGFPAYMVVSLPAVLLQSFPFEMRSTAKLGIYALAAAIGLFALVRAVLILRGADDARRYRAALALIMIEALLVLPLVLPHFLFYDMCCLSLLAVIAYQGHLWGAEEQRVKFLRAAVWWSCNLYYLSFMFVSQVADLKQWYALLLVALFALFFAKVPGVAGRRQPE
jgi:hypothetical protein